MKIRIQLKFILLFTFLSTIPVFAQESTYTHLLCSKVADLDRR